MKAKPKVQGLGEENEKPSHKKKKRRKSSKKHKQGTAAGL